MLGFNTSERFGDCLLSINLEYTVSYPLILPKEEVFFTYLSQKKEGVYEIIPGDIYRRNLETKEILKKSIEEEVTEDIFKTMTGKQNISTITGRELFKAEKELISYYEQIWENYYQTENKTDINLQKQWKQFFDMLVEKGPVLKMYQYFGEEMLEKIQREEI